METTSIFRAKLFKRFKNYLILELRFHFPGTELGNIMTVLMSRRHMIYFILFLQHKINKIFKSYLTKWRDEKHVTNNC